MSAREAAGFPRTVTDPATLARVVAILVAHRPDRCKASAGASDRREAA